MIVWVEGHDDAASTVWGCAHCHHGAWCPTPADALAEALDHARGHGITTVTLAPRRHGPRPQATRDEKITHLRAQGRTIREIAALVQLSTAGVIKALRRTQETP